uniref:Ig-like domain-containing protein n=1 Tax=Dicentrarchus labrax TaxID=13489 RepID=A0A8C4GYL5_DICLA
MSCQSQGSPALKHTLLYGLFYSKWDHQLLNEHHAVWKKTETRCTVCSDPYSKIKYVDMMFVSAGQPDVIGSDKPVTVTVGEDVILPCHLGPPFNVRTLTVEWTRDGQYVHVWRQGKDYLNDQDENFRGRTSLFHEEIIRGNISLKLTSVTELDAGSYTCNVPKLQSQVKKNFIILTVGEYNKPVTVTVGDNVILPCHLEPPFDVRSLTVVWTRDGQYVHVYRSRMDDPGSQDKNFRGRTSVFHEEMIRGNISLKLTNVTEMDAGSYTCFVPGLQSQVRRGMFSLVYNHLNMRIIVCLSPNELSIQFQFKWIYWHDVTLYILPKQAFGIKNNNNNNKGKQYFPIN